MTREEANRRADETLRRVNAAATRIQKGEVKPQVIVEWDAGGRRAVVSVESVPVRK